MNEQELWANMKSGDAVAFSLLYKKHASTLYRYGCKLTPDKELVKDSIQQIFLNVWNHKENLGQPASTIHYLLKALRLEILKKSGAKSSFESLSDDHDFLQVNSSESDLIQHQTSEQNQRRIQALLEKLPSRQREVIFLKYFANLKNEEIAAIMGIEQESVYKLTYKAIDKLQKLYFLSLGLLLLFFLAWV